MKLFKPSDKFNNVTWGGRDLVKKNTFTSTTLSSVNNLFLVLYSFVRMDFEKVKQPRQSFVRFTALLHPFLWLQSTAQSTKQSRKEVA